MTGLITRNGVSGIPSLFDDLWAIPRSTTVKYAPSFDIIEGEDEYVVTGDMPGMKAENIDISCHLNRLTISGARVVEGGNFHVRERLAGNFSRTFVLPKTANVSDVNATMADGVLTIKIPKTPEAKPQKIEVKVLGS